ncbi:MAG: response regulator [Candidatus Nitrosocosmicus sp.]
MKKRIMIVDDEEEVLFIFKNLLQKNGFLVDTFTEPLKAIKQYKDSLYQLVLVDIRMPKMNGFEFAQEIKSKDKHAKICFITAFEGYYNSLVDSFPNLDFKCFIKKPILGNELVEKIRIVLSR